MEHKSWIRVVGMLKSQLFPGVNARVRVHFILYWSV